MKKYFLLTMLLTALLLTSVVYAQPGQGMGGSGRPGWGPPQGDSDDDWDCRMIGAKLTDEQQAQIAKLRLENQKSMVEMRSEMHSLRSELGLLIASDNYRQSDADKIAAKLGKLHEDKIRKHAAHMRSIRQLLTPEQQVMFDSKVISGRMHGFEDGMRCPRGPDRMRPRRGGMGKMF